MQSLHVLEQHQNGEATSRQKENTLLENCFCIREKEKKLQLGVPSQRNPPIKSKAYSLSSRNIFRVTYIDSEITPIYLYI